MANLSDINSEFVTLCSAALSADGLTAAQVGSEWPAKDAIQNVGTGGPPLVALVHRMTTFKSMNMRFDHSETDNPCGIKSTLSDSSIAPTQSITLTIALAIGSSSVKVGDTVAFQLNTTNAFDVDNAATYVAVGGDTVSTVATALAAAIHTAFPTMTASASGGVITITSGDTIGYHASTAVGNGGTIEETTKWACRNMQVNIWTGNLADKFNYREAVETFIAALDDAHGFFLASGEWVNLKLVSSKPDDAETDKDIFCDLFIFDIEHMIDVPRQIYPVVAPVPDNS